MDNMDNDEIKVSRRKFLKASAVVAGAVLFAPGFIKYAYADTANTADAISWKYSYPGPDVVDTAPEVNVIYSSCLQCHNSCTNRIKVVDGVAVKADGNPYSPNNMKLPYEMGPEDNPKAKILPYTTDTEEAKAYRRGSLCSKGQSILQTTYDPYRVLKPMKRAGPRGSGKWEVISWETALNEIVNGGELPEAGGTRKFEGLKDIRNFDPIDPEIPELGPKANQFVWMAGRMEHGRKDLVKTWLKNAYGSVNFFEHTTICEQSHHIGIKHSMDNKNEQIDPDTVNCEFLVIVGTNMVEANFGPVQLARQLMEARAVRGMKLVVIDPRFNRTAAKADKWLPIKPGADAFLGLAMGRWIIEQKRYDETYLRNPNKKAAKADKEPTFSNATHLVKIENGEPTSLLTAREAVIENNDDHVVFNGEKPEAASKAEQGDLFVNAEVNGIKVKSAFQLYREETLKYTINEYAEKTGIPGKDIKELAREFTSHGKKAHITFYRGPAKHTNGFYNIRALTVLNFLIGNLDWQGGWAHGGGHYNETKGRYAIKGHIVPVDSKVKPGGVKLTREGSKYTDFPKLMAKEGKKPKRQWFPFTSSVYQEILPSARDKYPYPIKALILTMGTPTLSIPAGEIQKGILMDTEAVPLFVANDILIAETSQYADYIFPDVTILERWGIPHPPPTILIKTSKIRQPVIGRLGDTKSVEEIFVEISEKLGIPGYDKIRYAEYFYLKMMANIALEKMPVPAASSRDQQRFQHLRDRAPDAVTSSEWPRVAYVLARGCRVEENQNPYNGKYMRHQYGKITRFYDEETGTYINPITGKKWSGVPRYYPVMSSDGKEIKDNLPLHLITWKNILGGQSRTIGNKWLAELWDENFIWINPENAIPLGLKTGNKARIISATNSTGVEGKVMVTDEIMPGVVGASWHKGHFHAYGAKKTIGNYQFGSTQAIASVGMQPEKEDIKIRSTGICVNPVMREDTKYKVCLEDPIGGSCSFYDTMVKVVKVS